MNPRVVATLLVLLVTSTISAYADTKIDISGQVRVRNHLDKKSFHPDSPTYDYNYLRARLAFLAIVDSNSSAVIQIQDSRNFDDDSLIGALSGTRTNTKNLDAHQAYLQVNRLFVDGIGLKAGRFEVKFGNERLFGADDWNNVGLAFNGVMLSFERPSYKFNAFGLTGPMERRYESGHTALVWGGALRSQRHNVEILYYYENIDYNWPSDSTRLDRHTIALYGNQSLFGCNVEWNLAYQHGNNRTERAYATSYSWGIDAYMSFVELSRSTEFLNATTFSVGIDQFSGDDPNSDGWAEGFTAPYGSHHEFGGTMGYFEPYRRELSNELGPGLTDIYGKIASTPFANWQFDLVGHRIVLPHNQSYWLRDVFQSPWKQSNKIGWEVDFVVRTSAVKGLQLQGGLSAYFASELHAGLRDYDPGYYAYSQMTVDF